MNRILVVGISGAGKTTMARAVAERLRLPFHEMDSLHYVGPDWVTDPEFRHRVTEIASTPAWIFDSLGYPEVRDLLWAHADTVIWLDYSRAVIMPRVLRRSLRRTLRRERIFGGNVETWTGWLSREHPAWWAWTQHAARRSEITRRVHDPRFVPLHVIRLASPREADNWLHALRPAPLQ
ncbi:AAA family ATPase [Sphaerisporangium album]|uniref:AAA family ATPase n=1 Tax=Sphaerisporangium album TaxID=509200 RepID=A0A367FLD6_9ACTN|nr:AAA family ATPase [Sphaerisporangium album]RCG31084.1 AAA family ATPase [Sphaerisporangium album]